MKKVIIGIAVIGAIAYLSSSNANAREVGEWPPDYGPNNGKAVKIVNSTQLYKIVRGLRVAYENQQAYINDGSPEIITLSQAEFSKIGEITNAKIYAAGGYRQG